MSNASPPIERRTSERGVVFTVALGLWPAPYDRAPFGRDPGEPADPVTVVARLDNCGDLARVGGATQLHALVQAENVALRVCGSRLLLSSLCSVADGDVQAGQQCQRRFRGERG